MPRRELLALLILLLASAAACMPKTSEPPTSGPPGPVPDFTLPESTLATLSRSIHDRNAAYFGLCLADTLIEGREFHARFDPSDLIDFAQTGGVPPTDWRRPDEVSFFPRFVGRYPANPYDARFTLDAGRGGIENIGGPSQKYVYHLHYRVYSGAAIVTAGAVGMSLERVGLGSDFKITFWNDVRDTTGVVSWGMARLRF